jgi:hypothetical protein
MEALSNFTYLYLFTTTERHVTGKLAQRVSCSVGGKSDLIKAKEVLSEKTNLPRSRAANSDSGSRSSGDDALARVCRNDQQRQSSSHSPSRAFLLEEERASLPERQSVGQW